MSYVFAHSRAEERRLTTQARLYEPLTARLLFAAGILPGMRVLDLGSGMGDVSLLAARMVGPDGSVVGIDADPAMVDSAAERARAAGTGNVAFEVGDATALPAGERFDAVVGRMILMHLRDPVAVVRSAAGRVRPGGIVAFQDMVPTRMFTTPPAPFFDRTAGWVAAVMDGAGPDPHLGLRLGQVFAAAGLPGAQQRYEAPVGVDPADVCTMAAGVLGVMAPLIERKGIATADELDAATLEQRLMDDLREAGAVVVPPPLAGAWARVAG